MYVRDAKNRDEVWLLDHIEAMELDETAFRSRDYVVAVDEDSTDRAGFGRIRVHKTAERERTQTGRETGERGDVCELTSIGVLEGWRGQGVGAHVIERLCQHASDEGFDVVYALTDQPAYLRQFNFERIETGDLPAVLSMRLEEKREGVTPEAVPMAAETGRFQMPERLRERFKRAAERDPEDADGPDPDEAAEEFGIDSDSATYKYDTG
jgi:N-acetylglutamate synthase-like GNAT family acetyltransferase